MAKYRWFVGTEAQCNELIAAADTYYGYPNVQTKTQTWAVAEANPENENEFTIPLNAWMQENLTYDPAKLVDDYPFPVDERNPEEV